MAKADKKQRGSLEVTFVEPLIMTQTASGAKVALSSKSGIFHITWLTEIELQKGRVVLKKGWTVRPVVGSVDGRNLNWIKFENKALFGEGFLMVNGVVIKKVRDVQTGKVLFPVKGT